MDEGAAFGFFPQLRPRRRLQDPIASADVPLQVLRGRLAGLLGLPSDIGNIVRTPQPMEAFGSYEYEQPQQLPYTTEQFLKELPLAPTAPIGQLAGQAASFVPLNPAPLVRGAQKLGTMVGQGMAERVATGRPMLPSLLAEPQAAMFAVEPSNIKSVEDLLSYRGSHQAPNARRYGATLDDLTKILPDDVYSSQGKQLYGIGDKLIDSEWRIAALKTRGKPDAEVEVYRAVPKGVKDINDGDWVSTSKTYAKQHGESTLNGEYDILTKKVKAKTLSTEGYPYEYGYNKEFEYPQQAALDTAQKNAALPISEGGLGLPSNNTPMDRAKAMGFESDVYHATDAPQDFSIFTPSVKGKMGSGVYTSFEPAYAERYAGGETARTMPLMSRGEMANVDTRTEVSDLVRQQLANENPNFNIQEWKRLSNQELANRGYSGVDVDKERLVFNPSDLRSRFAAFDPMRRNESDILAGLLPASLLADPETRRKLDEELSLLYTK